jgi:hypothetical protein
MCYHKNIQSLYKKEWIDQYRYSVENQTYKNFDIIEINYGGPEHRIFKNSIYEVKEHETFVHCMNNTLDRAFLEYDYVLNGNCDDYQALNRIERQLKYLTKGVDVCASNFALIDSNGNEIKRHYFHDKDIAAELKKGHNVICHPSVAYSKRFWDANKYDPSEIPYEDLNLWQRSIHKFNFLILEDCLLYHRTHDRAVSYQSNHLKAII